MCEKFSVAILLFFMDASLAIAADDLLGTPGTRTKRSIGIKPANQVTNLGWNLTLSGNTPHPSRDWNANSVTDISGPASSSKPWRMMLRPTGVSFSFTINFSGRSCIG